MQQWSLRTDDHDIAVPHLVENKQTNKQKDNKERVGSIVQQHTHFQEDKEASVVDESLPPVRKFHNRAMLSLLAVTK